MKVAVQEFHKLHKPKINKLRGGYSATANLIFQSWLKDINIHVEDWNLTEREAIQLVKDFTAERARNEVEFYMGMITDDQQTFDGLVNHLKNAFQSGETISELISISTFDTRRIMNRRLPLLMTSRFWSGKLLPKDHLSGQWQMSSLNNSMPISCMTSTMQL